MAGKGINIVITADPATTKAALEIVRRELQETGEEGKRQSEQIAQGMEMIRGSLEAIGISLAAREVISELREMVSGALEFGEQMTKASQRTGLSVETLSTLHYAAAVTNSDFDGLINGLGKMNKLIGEAADGNKKAAGFVKGLGLDAKELAGRADGAEIAFHRFIDRLAATENPIRRNQFAMELLGRAGSAQIPMLIDVAQHWDEFKERAQAAGVQLTAETAKTLEDTNRRLADMKQHLEGAGIAMTEGLTPALTQMFSVISGGKSQMDAMKDFGSVLGKSLAFVGMVAYGAASGMESLFVAIENVMSAGLGGSATPLGRSLAEAAKKDLDAAERWNQKAQGMRDVMLGDAPSVTGGIPGEVGGPAGEGFEGGGGADGKQKSDNGIATAAAALLEEQGKLKADAQKYVDQAQIAEIETQHKLMLMSDADFYQEKLRLQEDALTVEEDALRAKLKTLADLNDKQHGDKGLKRDKDGNSAEELRTQREMVQVQEQLNALAARHLELASGSVAEQDASNRKSELAGLKLAADLERERNAGLTAQIALIEREHDLEAQKIKQEGGSDADADAARALGEMEIQKLRIAQVSQRIVDIEDQHKIKIEEINDAVAKDPRLKRQGEQASNQVNQQDANTLKPLVDQYGQLAATIGSPELIQKARELHLELDKLNRPDQRDDAQFAKTLTDGIESMSRRIADATLEGKKNFHSMVQSMEKDLLNLAIKLAEEKWITPIGTAGAKSKMPGLGGALPGLGQPAQLGVPQAAAAPSATSAVLGALGLGGAGKGSGGTQVKVNITNESSTPVAATQGTASMSDLHELVIGIFLKDLSEGGPTAQALSV